MSFIPLASAVERYLFKPIQLVATDMDGTLTQRGKFISPVIQALEDLAAANIEVIIVTGRSAGWVSGLATYLPIVGAIAENGGLFYPTNSEAPILLTSIPNLFSHRQQLAKVFQQLQTQFPQIEETGDNRFRITDWTFNVAGLNLEQLKIMEDICQKLGWGFTYSNVQCHIKPINQDKAAGLLQVLRTHFPHYTLEQIVTVGDSPNDEALFNPSYFPLSVGVANALEYTNQMKYQPAYVTTVSEGKGFCELADQLLKVS